MALSFLLNTWWFLVLIGVMILVHELGHFWAARAFNVKVEVFSFGFGPRLFGFRHGDTDYRFSLILFGGYVKMAGEQPGEHPDALPTQAALPNQAAQQESPTPPQSDWGMTGQVLWQKPRWQRLIIAAAGPLMNVCSPSPY